jgi:hypothetical protein
MFKMFRIWQEGKGGPQFDVKTADEIKAVIRAGDQRRWIIESHELDGIFGEMDAVVAVGYKTDDGMVVIEPGDPWARPYEEDPDHRRPVKIPGLDASTAASCVVRWQSENAKREEK